MNRAQRAAHRWIWVGVLIVGATVLAWALAARSPIVPIDPVPSPAGAP